MSDIMMTVVAILLATILMFLFPLMSVAERSDDMSMLTVQTAVTDFVDNSRAIGKITITNYQRLISTINATGNTYDVEIEVKKLDENVGKKSVWTSGTVIGENIYYSVYTSQITDILTSPNGTGVYNMSEGDIISVSVKNTNKTMAQTIRNAFYSISGNNTYQISAQHSGIVTATGSN